MTSESEAVVPDAQLRSSTFNHAEGKPPIALILTDGQGKYKVTTFESALPYVFSTAAFMPDALSAFLKSHPNAQP